ncbi:MAG: hypothetical protein Q8S17_02710 [Humidesulfovibrio sp.]|nr:hypothetical protein [Humidesulfovibrio sp.]
MKLPFGKPGISLFFFVALTLLFNWPLLSIPASEGLLGWLFCAWGLAIALLFLAAHGPGGEEALPTQPGVVSGLRQGQEQGKERGPERDKEPELRQGDAASREGGDV